MEASLQEIVDGCSIKTGRSTVSMTLKLPINNFCEFLRFLRDINSKSEAKEEGEASAQAAFIPIES